MDINTEDGVLAEDKAENNEFEEKILNDDNTEEIDEAISDQSFVLSQADEDNEELSEEEAFNLVQHSDKSDEDHNVIITKEGKTIYIDEISDEELDRIADTAIETLKEILQFFDVKGAEIEEFQGDDNEIILDVVGGDLAVLIGRHGATLDALQQIVSTINFNKLGFRYPITIDIESYKHRQKQKLISIAKNAASRAVRQHKSIRLRAMNPYERRLVHMILREDIRVQTQSEGKEPYRRVVISPIV